jgi:hypothetical protein
VLGSLDDGQEVIASQLSDLAAEAHAAIGEQDLGLANAAGMEKELTRDGVACRVLVAKAEIKPAEWDPACLSAPPHVDQTLALGQHALKSGASQRGRRAFKPSPELERAAGDTDIYHAITDYGSLSPHRLPLNINRR